MRLVKPSPGEAFDRMTILALKMKHSDRQEFKDEHQALIEYMQQNRYNVPTGLDTELGKINAKLWELEDRQRILIKILDSAPFPPREIDEFCVNARTVIHLNDARADTVKKINAACGIDSVEKLYNL